MRDKLKNNPQDGGERRNDSKAAVLLQERKKIIFNLILLGSAAVVVVIGILTMAWFANNTKVSGTNMSVTVKAPDGVKISVGHLASEDNVHYTISFDANDVIVSPTVGDTDDWFSEIDIGDYYLFGKLFPASSVLGEEIWYTADAKGNGRKLKTTHAFYRADNSSGASATAHAITYDDQGQAETWDYLPYIDWDNTRDDGYFIEVPVWFSTDSENAVNLTVRGYVTKNDGTTASDGDNNGEGYIEALYKATRVAILDESHHSANTSLNCGNVLPLLNGEQGNPILDSKNYGNGSTLYGVTGDGASTGWRYESYIAYTTSELVSESNITYHPVVSLTRSTSPKKRIVRIWLDGDDRDCWNATAGQNWKIHLIFSAAD